MVDPRRAVHPHPPGSGTVTAMNACRTVLFALAVLLTSGCVVVPRPASGPPARPAELAPAADRPPAPLPAQADPTQAPAREELAATAPRLVAEPAHTPITRPPAEPADTAAEEALRRPVRRTAAPPVAKKEAKPSGRKTRTRTKSTVPRKKQRNPAHDRRQSAAGQAPEMRRLCRDASRIQAPLGAADLCRSMYGR